MMRYGMRCGALCRFIIGIRSGLTAEEEKVPGTIDCRLGSGKPLFGSLQGDVRLQLLVSRVYDFWFVQSTHLV